MQMLRIRHFNDHRLTDSADDISCKNCYTGFHTARQIGRKVGILRLDIAAMVDLDALTVERVKPHALDNAVGTGGNIRTDGSGNVDALMDTVIVHGQRVNGDIFGKVFCNLAVDGHNSAEIFAVVKSRGRQIVFLFLGDDFFHGRLVIGDGFRFSDNLGVERICGLEEACVFGFGCGIGTFKHGDKLGFLVFFRCFVLCFAGRGRKKRHRADGKQGKDCQRPDAGGNKLSAVRMRLFHIWNLLLGIVADGDVLSVCR